MVTHMHACRSPVSADSVPPSALPYDIYVALRRCVACWEDEMGADVGDEMMERLTAVGWINQLGEGQWDISDLGLCALSDERFKLLDDSVDSIAQALWKHRPGSRAQGWNALDGEQQDAYRTWIWRSLVSMHASRLRRSTDLPESVDRVLCEVKDERAAQDQRFGQQDYPSLPPGIQQADVRAYFMAPPGNEAKALLEDAFRAGLGSYAHVFWEEVCEAMDELNDERRLRSELKQVAAVCVAWVEAIDRRSSASQAAVPSLP